MRKADYNSVIDQYEQIALELAIIDPDGDIILESGIALEAESATNTVSATQSTQIQNATARANTNGNMTQNANGQKSAEINARKAVSDTFKNDQNKDKNANSTDKMSKLQQAMQTVKNFLKKIASILENLRRVLSNRFKLMMQNDRGFFNLYNKQKQIQKPQENVKVVNYKYTNQVLEAPMQGITRDLNNCLRALSMTNEGAQASGRVSEILQADKGHMAEALFKPYCKDSRDPVTSAPEFIKYIVGKYRGEKSETVYNSNDIPAIEKNAMASREISNRCQAYIRECEQIYNRIKGLQNQLGNNVDEKVVEMVKQNASKAAILYNVYNSLIHMYYEVRLEQSMNYRIILKRFYNMK